jgi:peptidoglycan/xylan/chitin deacetylase (PgdA/CDA1 family)
MRKLYSSAIWRVPTKEKIIFLTFDDGPVPEITPWVLSVLKEHRAKATFFCVGANIEKHPAIFRQILSEGHSVGNHTYNHLNGWKTKTKEYLENVEKCTNEMVNGKWLMANGAQPLFRPPYGKLKRSQISFLSSQFSIIMWDVLSGDFDKTLSGEKCLKNVISKTREGSIVVFHDSIKAQKNLFYALPKFLEHFSKEGYTFEALPPSPRGIKGEESMTYR